MATRIVTKGKEEKESMLELDIRNVDGHYEIYKDGRFVCSCDTNELRETLEELGS
jgi:hypothetical protein